MEGEVSKYLLTHWALTFFVCLCLCDSSVSGSLALSLALLGFLTLCHGPSFFLTLESSSWSLYDLAFPSWSLSSPSSRRWGCGQPGPVQKPGYCPQTLPREQPPAWPLSRTFQQQPQKREGPFACLEANHGGP